MVAGTRLETDRWYDADSLSVILGIADRDQARARKAGELRYRKVGKRILHKGEWLLEWLEREPAESGA